MIPSCVCCCLACWLLPCQQIEEQPKWNAGVKMSQVIGRVNQTTTHVKQVLQWGRCLLLLTASSPQATICYAASAAAGANARSMCSQQGCIRAGFMACTMATGVKQQQSWIYSNTCHVDVCMKPCCDCMACRVSGVFICNLRFITLCGWCCHTPGVALEFPCTAW